MSHDSASRPITNHAAMGAATTSSRNRQPFLFPTRTPRLLLRRRDAEPAPVDGAWWPRTRNLTTELHELISALSSRLGPLARIGFDWNANSRAQRRIEDDDGIPTPSPEPDRPPDVMQLVATDGTSVSLLIVPSDTDLRLAGERMRQAVA
ncbi:DUF5994 family protein [Nocardia brevicatena]|uniref:DUF5994 family protein n=1 Tax=Nocardia brevicatena TaxID=37327 RepID=UPI000594A617|nr:DUF5994 family protein [Nocardia brevicatena]